ncbi:hypothetical protein FQA39_LY04788 [Lamprigera yunnana]|nr:hypothetical protein FQA39_LY04787 [Lamprigera yunnana]KAF5283412.1 hypothetical protein FQA39_LY04788 [Lamprigera yunnana]
MKSRNGQEFRSNNNGQESVTPITMWWEIDKLKNEETVPRFQYAIVEGLKNLKVEENETVDDKWNKLKEVVPVKTEDGIGKIKKKNENSWFDQEYKEKVELDSWKDQQGQRKRNTKN